jgi:hypothetical protein
MRDAYKVAVWGPGALGRCAIREINILPELELVSVLAYSKLKCGQDAGIVAGCGEMGVTVTDNVRTLLDAKPEIVIYTTRDIGDFNADKDILMLLEAGVNVVTPLPYFHFRERGTALRKTFEDAGQKGGATLHATGISPTFLFERLAGLLTDLSNNIESISLYEYFNIEHKGEGGADAMKSFGMGQPIGQVESTNRLTKILDNYFRQSIFTLAETLGVHVDRIERTAHHVALSEPLSVPKLIDVEIGAIGVISHKWTSYSGAKPFFTYQVYWYPHSSIAPDKAKGHGDDYWLIEIEGTPCLRVGIELKHSLKPEDAPTPKLAVPAFIATVTTMIHAIPHVVSAAPGILPTATPSLHWKPDLRF